MKAPDFDLDALAAEFAEDALRTGKFAEHADALVTMVDMFEHEPWWDDSLPAEDVVETEAFKRGFRVWMPKRVRFAFEALKEDLAEASRPDGRLEIARAMAVPEGWASEVSPGDPLGVFWAADHESSDIAAYQGDQSLPQVTIEAVCDPEVVDWKETLRSRTDYLNGDDEAELRLLPDARVEVVGRTEEPPVSEGEYGTARHLEPDLAFAR